MWLLPQVLYANGGCGWYEDLHGGCVARCLRRAPALRRRATLLAGPLCGGRPHASIRALQRRGEHAARNHVLPGKARTTQQVAAQYPGSAQPCRVFASCCSLSLPLFPSARAEKGDLGKAMPMRHPQAAPIYCDLFALRAAKTRQTFSMHGSKVRACVTHRRNGSMHPRHAARIPADRQWRGLGTIPGCARCEFGVPGRRCGGRPARAAAALPRPRGCPARSWRATPWCRWTRRLAGRACTGRTCCGAPGAAAGAWCWASCWAGGAAARKSRQNSRFQQPPPWLPMLHS